MSDQFFYLQLRFIPKIGHTFTNEREVVIEVPKGLVARKSKVVNEGLKEVVALDLAKSTALGTFPTDAERALAELRKSLPARAFSCVEGRGYLLLSRALWAGGNTPKHARPQ